jgi:signal transduction histidine kinase/CheY-like chemotaxis protein
MFAALYKVMMAPGALIALSNVLFAISYLTISVMLAVIRWRRTDIVLTTGFRTVLMAALAGAVAPVVRLYDFGPDGLLLAALGQFVPALITFAAALILWRLLPGMLSLPSSVQLREANEALRHEMAERRIVEAALLQSRKMEALGRISGGLAHEFNNMLQVVSGNIGLIVQECHGGPEIGTLAAAIQDSVERGVLLTGKLMSFSQEQNALLEPVPVPDLVASLSERVAAILPPRITLEIEGGAPEAAVLIDVTQMELALLNIATNSGEAMPGGGHLRIGFSPYQASGRRDLPDGDYLSITVADTGLGMAPTVVDRAFDPFYSTKPMGVASGLGLSMVYAMAQRSGGTATIQSWLGEGTTVTIYLKLVAPNEDLPAIETPVAAGGTFSGRRIMLVDDEAATRSVVALTLESLDCAVVVAENGTEALALTEEAWPDLFLLDYAMPTMTGLELAEQLRARNPSSRFMFLTGFADITAIRTIVGSDAVILQKPVSRDRLALALTTTFAGPA